MKASKKEFIIGLCVAVSLLVLFFGIDFLKGVNVFKAANYYYAQYTNVAGLQVSAPVTLNGFKVGQVRSLQYEFDNPGHVKVELSLDKALQLPSGTKAVIEQDLLGTATVVLKMADSGEFYKVGSMIPGETSQGMMEGVSQNLMPKVNAVFPKIDSLLTSINRLVSDPALLKSVQRLDAITLNLEQTMKQVNATTRSLDPVMANVTGITENLNTVSDALAAVSEDLKAAPIDSVMQNVAVMSDNLKVLSAQLNDPNSSLGLITHDRDLYDNLNGCAASLDSLLIDVKRNPKRYISIKLL